VDFRFQIADFDGLFAVHNEATKIETNSLASALTKLVLSTEAIPESTSSSIQNNDSSASSRTIPNFETKSAVDLARQTAR
jgi:hypothetical protein